MDEDLKAKITNLEAENYLLKILCKKYYSELERLQPDLYKESRQAEIEVFKYADFVYETSLRTVKTRSGYKPKKMKLTAALFKATELKNSKFITKANEARKKYFEERDKYFRDRRKAKRQGKEINKINIEKNNDFEVLYDSYLLFRDNLK